MYIQLFIRTSRKSCLQNVNVIMEMHLDKTRYIVPWIRHFNYFVITDNNRLRLCFIILQLLASLSPLLLDVIQEQDQTTLSAKLQTLQQSSPLLKHFINIQHHHLVSTLATHRSMGKLLSVLLSVFTELGLKVCVCCDNCQFLYAPFYTPLLALDITYTLHNKTMAEI